MRRLDRKGLEVEWINEKPEDEDLIVFFWSSGCPHCQEVLEEMEQIGEEHNISPVAVHRNDYGFEHPVKTLDHDMHFAEDNGAWDELGNSFQQDFILFRNGKIEKAGGMEDVTEHLDAELRESQGFREHRMGFRQGTGVNKRGNFIGRRELPSPEHRTPGEVFLKGEWRMTEDSVEAVDKSVLHLKEFTDSFHLSVEGDGTVEVLVDGQHPEGENGGLRLTPGKGRSFEVFAGEKGMHELTLKVDGDISIHSVFAQDHQA